MMSSRSIAIVAGFILSTGVSAVQATVVEWQLQNVRFDDGGTATGFISIDVHRDGFGATPGSNPQLVDWDIKVRGGNTVDFPLFEYTPASTFEAHITLSITQGGGPSWDTLIFNTSQMLPGGEPFQRRGLYLVTRPQMTDAGGRVILAADNIPSRESWNPMPGRMASGALTAVPEPSNVTLLALGFAALLGAWARPQALTRSLAGARNAARGRATSSCRTPRDSSLCASDRAVPADAHRCGPLRAPAPGNPAR